MRGLIAVQESELVVERVTGEGFNSNSYLLGYPGADCVIVDAGAPAPMISAAAARHGMRPVAVLLTHHHVDHVGELEDLLDRIGLVDVFIHPDELALAEEFTSGINSTVEDGELIKVGEEGPRQLQLRAVSVPGHCAGMLAYLGHGQVFTGDILMRGTVGSIRVSGCGDFDQLRESICDVLMELDGSTTVRPGHGDPSTVGHERATNPFVRAWMDGEFPEPDEILVSMESPGVPVQHYSGTLLVRTPDDGRIANAWVRWPDGRNDLVPCSWILQPEE